MYTFLFTYYYYYFFIISNQTLGMLRYKKAPVRYFLRPPIVHDLTGERFNIFRQSTDDDSSLSLLALIAIITITKNRFS